MVLAAGSGVAYLLYALKPEPPRRPQNLQPPVVDTIRLVSETVVESLVGYGTAKPDRFADLSAEVASTVVERAGELEAGSIVQAGDVLLRLDDREYQFALQQAIALAESDRAALSELAAEERSLTSLIATAKQELKLAESEKQRVSRLYENQQAASKEFNSASLAHQQARRTLQAYERENAAIEPNRIRLGASLASNQAGVAIATLNVERCTIKAPFAGKISAIHVDAGDRLNEGRPVARLIDSRRVEIPIRLPASVYARVRLGTTCRITVESIPDAYWQGSIARIAPDIDEKTRTFAAFVEVDNGKQETPLIPGAFVRAEVRGGTWRDRIVVPRGAVRDGWVLVVEDGKVTKRAIRIEKLVGGRAVVADGLRVGDEVIVSQFARLTEGTPVRPRLTLTARPTTATPTP